MEKNVEEGTGGEIVLYRPDEKTSLEVRIDADTVWLTQQQIAELFGKNQPAISKHISNIYREGELTEKGTYSISEYMGNDGKQLYTGVCEVGFLLDYQKARKYWNKLKQRLVEEGLELVTNCNQLYLTE
ncbi:MAG: hypothetical protein MJY56_04480 [Bacteroidales bacterium]|nr:hypothetical protein [Bacteroidales bacterium]